MASNQTPCYLLPPDFTLHPDTHLQLGILLPSSHGTPLPLLPFDSAPHIPPSESTTTRFHETPHSPPPPSSSQDPPSRPSEPDVWLWTGTHSHGSTRTLSASIPFLAGPVPISVGAKVNLARGQTLSTTVRAARVETESFVPTPEYIAAKLVDLEAKDFARRIGGLRSPPPVFMVTGRKIAWKAWIEVFSGKGVEVGGGGEVGLGLGMGMDGGGGPGVGIEGKRTRAEENSQRTYREGPFVLGYRVLRLRLKRGFEAKMEKYEGRGVLMDDETGTVDIADARYLDEFWDVDTVGEETSVESED